MLASFIVNSELNIRNMEQKYIKTDWALKSIRHKYNANFISSHELREYLENHEEGLGKAKEVIQTNDLVLVLTDTGVCVGMSKNNPAHNLCLLNDISESICAMFHNKKKESIVFVAKKNGEWKVKDCSIQDILEGNYHQESDILTRGEEQKWPSSIQFDELNEKMIMHYYSPTIKSSSCIIHNITDYLPTFSLDTTGVCSVQISQDMLILTYQLRKDLLNFKVYSIHNGEFLRELSYLLPQCKLEFSVAFNEVIIIKPENKNVVILDIVSGNYSQLKTPFTRQSKNFLVPLRHDFFVCRYEGMAWVLDKKGRVVSSFPATNLFANLYTMNDEISRCIGFRFGFDLVEIIDISSGKIVNSLKTAGMAVDAMNYHPSDNSIITVTHLGIQFWSI